MGTLKVDDLQNSPFCYFQGSTAISSADLFGDSADSSIDLAASDLLNRLSFQVCFWI